MIQLNDSKDTKKCPECGSSYKGVGTLSRRNTETEICSECGIFEALEDAGYTTIKDMNLSLKTFTCLKMAKIYTIDDLKGSTREDLLKLRCMNERQVDEIVNRNNITLKETNFFKR